MKLFIAEKPSLGRAIAEVIGIKSSKNGYVECKNDTIVTWCFGHILELSKPEQYIKQDDDNQNSKRWRLEDLPIIPDRWVKYVKDGAKDQFKVIKSLAAKADVIINAGDPDREGQLLVDEVIEYLHVNKPVKRIWLQALDRENILKALNNIDDNKKYLPYKLSAEARSYSDWLVGMNFTRYFSLKANNTLPVGRVQTPTLALIVQRDLAIQNFHSHPYYVLHANFDTLQLKADLKVDENMDGLDEEGRLIKKDIAEQIAKETTLQPAKVLSFKKTAKKEYPPLPFNLSSLQKYLSGKMSLSAQKVLSYVQELYEKKLTTYPRTDCSYIAEEQFKDAKKILSSVSKLGVLPDLINSADFAIKHEAFNSSKITAHTAIIPTGDISAYSKLNDTARKVYHEIVKAYACLFQKPHEYYAATIEFDIKGFKFTSNLKQTINEGFRRFCGGQEKSLNIPNVKAGDTFVNKQTDIETLQTTPPQRFSDGTLIEAMSHIHRYIDDEKAKAVLKENDGLGTEATRAGIIEQLVKRGYLERKGKQLISTTKARELIQQLPNFIKDPVLTARWERGLNGILRGESTFEEFLEAQKEFIRKEIQKNIEIRLSSESQDRQNQTSKQRTNKGKQTKKQNYNKQGNYNNKQSNYNKQSTNKTNFTPAKNGPACPSCAEPLAKYKTKSGKDYYFCRGCKSAYWIDKGGQVGKKWEFAR